MEKQEAPAACGKTPEGISDSRLLVGLVSCFAMKPSTQESVVTGFNQHFPHVCLIQMCSLSHCVPALCPEKYYIKTAAHHKSLV